jgi:hypothetical protein
MFFAAIEVHQSEAPQAAVEVFMREAAHRGLPFKRLEVLRLFDFGTRRYAHVRTDCRGMLRIVKTLQPTRAMIIPMADGSYKAHLPGGKYGKVSHATMHTVPKPIQRVYRGPAVEHWERQFLVMPKPG